MINPIKADIFPKNGDKISFSHKEIINLIPVYAPEHIFIEEAHFDNNDLVCRFRSFDYPFSSFKMKHFTREHALVYLTQATYLIIAIQKNIDEQWPLETTESLELARNEQMTFTKIEINFRRFIENKTPMEIRISILSYRKLLNRLILELNFNFPKGCYGNCKCLIALNKELKMLF